MIGGLGSLTGGVLGAIYIGGELLPAAGRLAALQLGPRRALRAPRDPRRPRVGRSSASATSACAGSPGAASSSCRRCSPTGEWRRTSRRSPKRSRRSSSSSSAEELPVSWVRRKLEEVTGGGPVYPLLILFGLNAVDELDRTAFGILLPEIRDALRARQPGHPLDRRPDRRRGAGPPDPDRPLRRPRTAGAAGAPRRGRRGRCSRSPPGWPSRCGSSSSPAPAPVIGKAVVDPTHNSLIADYYPPEHRPKVYSFHRAANAVGAFIGPLLAGIIAFNTSWRVPFFVFAVPTLIVVVLGLRVKEPVRGEHERRAMGASDEAVHDRGGAAELRRGAGASAVASRRLRRIWWALPFLAASLIGLRVARRPLLRGGVRARRASPRRSWPPRWSRPSSSGSIVGARIGTKLVARDPGLILRFLGVLSFIAAGLLAGFALSPWLWLVRRRSTRWSPALLAAIGPGHLRRAGHGDPASGPGDRVQHRFAVGPARPAHPPDHRRARGPLRPAPRPCS